MTRRTASWLLFAAVLLHNGEEALTYAAARPGTALLLERVGFAPEPPQPAMFQAALLVVTLGVAAVLAWTAGARNDRAGWLVLKATAAVFLANVAVPHVPAAIALGGYAPGVATAVAINLPLTLWILLRSGPRPSAQAR